MFCICNNININIYVTQFIDNDIMSKIFMILKYFKWKNVFYNNFIIIDIHKKQN